MYMLNTTIMKKQSF